MVSDSLEPKRLSAGRKKRKSRGGRSVFREWLKTQYPNESRSLEDIPPAELDTYLTAFYSTVKTPTGADYDAKTLYFMRVQLDGYLRLNGYSYSIHLSRLFPQSQEMLRRRLTELPMHSQDWISHPELLLLYQLKVIFSRDPSSMLYIILLQNILNFSVELTTKEDHCNLLWGDVQLKTDCLNKEYLLLTGMRKKVANKRRKFKIINWVHAIPDQPQNCPVHMYKEHVFRRPDKACLPQSPFYLMPLKCVIDDTWFANEALGSDAMDLFVTTIKQAAWQSSTTQ